MEREASDTVLFIGRFHPLVLHLPIGFLIIAFALEILTRFDKFRQHKPIVGFVLFLGASFTVVAAALGYMLAQAGGYDVELLAVHQWFGMVLTFTAIAAFLLHRKYSVKPSALWSKAYISVLSLMMIFLIVAAHYGGSLTHGSDYLIQYMPNSLRLIAGLPVREKRTKITNLKETVAFAKIIHPILDAHCISCHNHSKSKGDLQMHTVEGLIKGGENGPLFVPGNAEESRMIERIRLPKDDEHHMPPEGKSQLTDDEIELLAWWVSEGASFEKKVGELQVNDEVDGILNLLVDPHANKTQAEILLASEVNPADQKTLGEIEKEKIKVKPLASQRNWLKAGIPDNTSGDSLIERLIRISQQITWLDMKGAFTTDKALASISNFKNLTRLHLENSQITDQGLQHLIDSQYLEYLNLYGTHITDKGIQQLSGLKNLKKLYVWQTNVTKQGASRLQQLLPDLEITLGVDNKSDNSIQNPNAAFVN